MTKKTSIFILSLLSLCALNTAEAKWTDWIPSFSTVTCSVTGATLGHIALNALLKASPNPSMFGYVGTAGLLYGLLPLATGVLGYYGEQAITKNADTEWYNPKKLAVAAVSLLGLAGSLYAALR